MGSGEGRSLFFCFGTFCPKALAWSVVLAMRFFGRFFIIPMIQ